MIRNKTKQFKQRYSNSVSTKQLDKLINNQYPNQFNKQLATTGFTNFSNQKSTISTSSNKYILKAGSNTSIKNKINKTEQSFKKFTDNSRSHMKIRNFDQNEIEKPSKKHFFNNVLRTETCQNLTSYHSFKSVKRGLKIEQKQSVQKFFENLTPRCLFFCCKCYQYIFAIEKNLHYPKCESQINFLKLTDKQKTKIGWDKLKLIVNLSQYTKHRLEEIAQLYEKVKKRSIITEQDPEIEISPNTLFLKFQQINQAFLFTHEMLLKGKSYNSSNIFSLSKIFECIQAKNHSRFLNQVQ